MNNLTLYHGSKEGIIGKIKPNSRKSCDFGQGFYMGTNINQPLTLICNYQNPKIYTLNLDLTNLKTKEFNLNLEWALFIAFNRGIMDNLQDSKIYKHFKEIRNNYDLFIGFIANDRLFITLDKFFNNEITDEALIHSLSALDLGKQYVAVTEKACKGITIIKEESISTEDRKNLKIKSEKSREEGIELTEQIGIHFRRIGLYFDEILEEGIIDE